MLKSEQRLSWFVWDDILLSVAQRDPRPISPLRCPDLRGNNSDVEWNPCKDGNIWNNPFYLNFILATWSYLNVINIYSSWCGALIGCCGNHVAPHKWCVPSFVLFNISVAFAIESSPQSINYHEDLKVTNKSNWYWIFEICVVFGLNGLTLMWP